MQLKFLLVGVLVKIYHIKRVNYLKSIGAGIKLLKRLRVKSNVKQFYLKRLFRNS